jgi:transposase
MLVSEKQIQILFCTEAVDMRKGANGLAGIVHDSMMEEPLCGKLFVFQSKRGDSVKIFYWHHNGFAVWSKRLQAGRYQLSGVKYFCRSVSPSSGYARMKFLKTSLFVALLLLISMHSASAEAPPEAIRLNDDGVAALYNTHRTDNKSDYAENLTDRDWQVIIDKFQAALKIDPTFESARFNLSIAHNNFALYLGHEHKFADALKQFHEALYLEPNNLCLSGR